MLIMRFVWFRRGLRALMCELDCLRKQGWYIKDHDVKRGLLGLRWLVTVHLEQE